MLTPPDDLPDTVLATVLANAWSLSVTSLAYRPVGFGSHHWEVVDACGNRWFATADDLDTKRRHRDEPRGAALDRLRASLSAAAALHRHGRTFVVAPEPTRDGGPLAPVGGLFAVALYPFIDGRSYPWGEFSTAEHRHDVLKHVIAVHAADEPVRRNAPIEDFAIAHRDDLEAALDPADPVRRDGPYAGRTTRLLADNAAPIRRVLAEYDELVEEGRAEFSRAVLTHGEPHPGNTMRTDADGWLLIDWETASVAPPERDLWLIEPGDGSVLDAYADATGVTPLSSMLRLYRIRWHLTDIAVSVNRFRQPHGDSTDDAMTFDVLRGVVAHLAG